MKLPRNLTGAQLIKSLDRLGAAILAEIASHHSMTRDTLIRKLFGK